MEVAEAVHLGMQAITRFSQLEIVGKQLVGAVLQKSPVFATAELIAGIPTMKALSGLSVEMGHTFLKLGTERKPLLLLKRQIEEKNAVKQLYVVAPALVAARDERGLSIAGDQYEAIVRGAQEKMAVYLEEFLERNRLH